MLLPCVELPVRHLHLSAEKAEILENHRKAPEALNLQTQVNNGVTLQHLHLGLSSALYSALLSYTTLYYILYPVRYYITILNIVS